ncbi:response regulator transcription factor [Dongia rigui]|uniref:Response regulator transcription factor n=1 Tax=Dongia rigui TaxID=940149 RepID=A0ABU5DW21_9PROT|nr:response regulator transcription factor [Dongia rigui]MDY0871177.1 response regulator transcription factor [Dongia rigui]
MRVLLIEDEPALGAAVEEHIRESGHAVDRVLRLDDAEAALRAVDYGLVLLDLNLPDGSGLTLLKAMRRAGDARPVIILTARDQVRDRIDGLNAGADDYLVKPFDLDELAARVAAVARRSGGNPNTIIRLRDMEIDTAARHLKIDGKRVDLTSREWAILEALLRRPGAIISKEQLEDALYSFDQEVESNTIEVHVSRLRKKLGKDVISTIRGVGYRLEDN